RRPRTSPRGCRRSLPRRSRTAPAFRARLPFGGSYRRTVPHRHAPEVASLDSSDCPSNASERPLLSCTRKQWRLPDELGDFEPDGSLTGLAAQNRDGVVEAGVAQIARRMDRRTDNLPAVVACAAVAAVVEGDLRAVLGLDHALKVGQV